MPLEDKDNQGGTWVAPPMNTNSSTKNQQKNQERLTEEEHAIVYILISRIEA